LYRKVVFDETCRKISPDETIIVKTRLQIAGSKAAPEAEYEHGAAATVTVRHREKVAIQSSGTHRGKFAEAKQ
jgi:hypothetical protein